MKNVISRVISSLMLLVLAFSVNSQVQQNNGSLSESVSPDLNPLAQVLNRDGTINQKAKATGSFDVSGYEMSYGANGEPVFSPKGVNSEASGEGYWSDDFPGPPGTDGQGFCDCER